MSLKFWTKCASLIVLLILLAFVLGTRHELAQASTRSQAEFYTVQAGDSWRAIATRFGVPVRQVWQANGVTNPAALREGQRLFIPTSGVRPAATVQSYLVGSRVALFRTAVGSGNSEAYLLLLNGLESAASSVGLRIAAPNRSTDLAVIAEASPAATPPQSALPDQPTPTPPPPTTAPQPRDALVRSRLGIQGFFLVGDEQRHALLDQVAGGMGFRWVKQQVRWEEYEVAPGIFAKEAWERLDAFVNDANKRGLNILLGVAKPPAFHMNPAGSEDPVNYEAFNHFLRLIVERYPGQLNALEVWNEPNLAMEWGGQVISGGEYVEMLAGAYATINSADPEGYITVVSAGLAPTGVTDGVTAVDDRLYLRQMYEAGLANHTDAVGIHPYGWANAPWAHCCGPENGAPTHNDHPTFFFLNTIEDYRRIQEEFGDSARRLWATEFGWGTMDQLGRPVPAEASFFNFVDEQLQAEYIVAAYKIAQDWDYMGPMFLWNLNIAALPYFDDSHSGYSILRSDGTSRHAMELLQSVPKIDS